MKLVYLWHYLTEFDCSTLAVRWDWANASLSFLISSLKDLIGSAHLNQSIWKLDSWLRVSNYREKFGFSTSSYYALIQIERNLKKWFLQRVKFYFCVSLKKEKKVQQRKNWTISCMQSKEESATVSNNEIYIFLKIMAMHLYFYSPFLIIYIKIFSSFQVSHYFPSVTYIAC